MNDSEKQIARALGRFGWTCGPEFWRRYYTDTWVFNLANAVEALTLEAERSANISPTSRPAATPDQG